MGFVPRPHEFICVCVTHGFACAYMCRLSCARTCQQVVPLMSQCDQAGLVLNTDRAADDHGIGGAHQVADDSDNRRASGAV